MSTHDPSTKRTRLISVGWCDTIPASELKVGMRRLYNYGAVYTVVAVEELNAGRWLVFTMRDDKTGKEYVGKRVKATTPVVPFPTTVWSR
jgi:hypothetical protein